MSEMTILVEPKTVVEFDGRMRGKIPFYRAVNAAMRFFIDVYDAKDGDVIDFPVLRKLGKIQVVVRR